jgi:hypothetical protein
MKKVKITKLKAAENPKYPTPDFEGYELGKENGNVSLPSEYTIEGIMEKDPVVGSSVFVERASRNGVKSFGLFYTSLVTEITENGFKTQNSIYQLEVLEKLD